MELFHQIQPIAAKIKATGNQAILENNEEYVALVGDHLSKEVMWDWFKQRKSGWSNFYLFLEDIAQTAKMQLTSESIRSALSGDQGDKTKCSSCNKYHSGKCNKLKNTAALNQGGENSCPVCNKPSHIYKTRTGAEAISRLVKDCSAFKAAYYDQN